MIILPLAVILVGVYVLYRMFLNFKSKKIVMGIVELCIGGFLILFGASGVSVATGSNSSSSSSQSSSVSKESSSDDENAKYSSSVRKQKRDTKKGLEELNNKIDSEPDLNGLTVKVDKNVDNGETFNVTIPDSGLNGNDAEQRKTMKTIFNLIGQYTGVDNPSVYYYDTAGNEIAKTKWDGEIKLENE